MDKCMMQFIKKIQQDATMYKNFIIPYLYEAQHVSGDTPPIIRSLELHWQPLVFHTWKVVGRCQAHYVPDKVQENNDRGEQWREIGLHARIILKMFLKKQVAIM
jgi:hypothetical protein